MCVFFSAGQVRGQHLWFAQTHLHAVAWLQNSPADLRVGSDSLHIPWVTVLGVRTGKTTRYQLKKVDNIAPWKFLKFNGEFTPEIWYLEDDPCCSFFWFMYFFSGKNVGVRDGTIWKPLFKIPGLLHVCVNQNKRFSVATFCLNIMVMLIGNQKKEWRITLAWLRNKGR